MSLTRKTRTSGSSIVVTIPSQLVEAYDIQKGDLIEIMPLRNGEIMIKKTDTKNYFGGKNGWDRIRILQKKRERI